MYIPNFFIQHLLAQENLIHAGMAFIHPELIYRGFSGPGKPYGCRHGLHTSITYLYSILTPLFEKKGGAWAKIEVYFARYLKRREEWILMTQSLCKGKENMQSLLSFGVKAYTTALSTELDETKFVTILV
jgi:hypothetical protein